MFYSIGILCAIIIVGRIIFSWFDSNNALPSKSYLERRRKWPD